MSIANAVQLLGGIALFLFGMQLMGDSLKKVAGSRLELVLYRLSGTPFKGVLLGAGVTSVIQSSSATSVMAVGFVNSGMMKLRQAVAIIMGAIIGTSVTGWILCLSEVGSRASGVFSLLSTDSLASIAALIGILLYMIPKKQEKKHTGGILLGFAVLMFGMKFMSGAMEGLKSNEAFLKTMTDFSSPLLGILAGAAMTAVLQSASAAVGILQALSLSGAVNFAMALPILMGVTLGAAVPVIVSSIGTEPDAKRAAWSYLMTGFLGLIPVAVVFYTLNAFLHFPVTQRVLDPVGVALVNTVYRVLVIALVAPAVGLVEKVTERIVREKAAEKETQDMDRLEERFLIHPALAIEQTRLAVNSMARLSERNLMDAADLLDRYSKEGFAAVERDEGIVDRYEDKIGTYLVRLTGKELDAGQNSVVSTYLHAINDFERLSDHALNMAESAQEIHEKKIVFSPDAVAELRVLAEAVLEIVSLSVYSFTGEDRVAALKIEPLEELIDNLCDEIKLRHIDRVQAGTCTLLHGFVFNDLLTTLERVADHCSNIGVALLQSGVGGHDYLKGVKSEHTEAYREAYAAYAAKYKLKEPEENA